MRSDQAVGFKYKSPHEGYEVFHLTHHKTERGESACTMMRYRSSTCTWSSMPSLRVAAGSYLECDTIVICNAALYTLWRKANNLRILAHDDGEWKEVRLPFSDSTKKRAFLMDSGGILHMVVVEHEGLNFSDVSSNIAVWKLVNGTWDEVTRVSSTLLIDCRYRLNRVCYIECVGKNGVIFLTSTRFFSEWLVLTYDAGKDEWSWLWRCKASLACINRSIAVFEPSLTATV
ncbi:hypothetical protein KP509_21G051600 [Ceratopteris richardii]|uniref:Uncharacterized protein n=1 Tax=Ceratopteris richardii TaxID=49495 RepID=A0A8T2SBZ1_CERRI|nr:hypothetical protein KP509_21G051600 [Ceratopteris richardii]